MSDTEQRARDMGWVPKEEFRGSEDRWVDAETFVERGENVMPILKERLGKMESTIEALRAENEKVKGSLTHLATHHRGTWKRMYNKALEEVQAGKRQAVQEADLERYQALEEQEQAILEEAAQENPDTKPTVEGAVPEFEVFHAANPWYGSDGEMTMYANGLQAILVEQGVQDNATFFKEIEKRVRQRFPEKFRNDNQALPPAVEGGEGAGGAMPDNSGKGWGDIPKADRDAFIEHFGHDNLMSKEEYAKEYWLMQ